MNERILDICHAAIDEYERATSLYPEFHSCHEGYAVIREEVDELWDAIKAEKGVTATEHQVEEAIQVMAMCIKYIMSLGGKNVETET